MTINLYCGDSKEVLSTFPDNHFHALVTDPPAGIALMGKDWDKDKGGRDEWIKWLSGILTEAYRVLRPGAFGVIWALPRTSHWTAMAAEDAGFQIHDIVHHLFGSGMPMGQNVAKAFDKQAGSEGISIGERPGARNGNGGNSMYGNFKTGDGGTFTESLPDTELATQWFGWHTRLKPAVEHWILVSKPIKKITIIDNIKKYQTGAMNIEACRVKRNDGYEKAWDTPVSSNISAGKGTLLTMAQKTTDISANKPSGGFPANLVLSHTVECIYRGVKQVKGRKSIVSDTPTTKVMFNDGWPPRSTVNHTNPDGTESVEDWQCVDGCPVKELDGLSGNSKSARSQRGKAKIFSQKIITGQDQWVGDSTERGFKDSGGASRFFNVFEAEFGYFAKASNKDKYFWCKDCNVVLPFVIGKTKMYEEHKGHDLVAHPTPKSLKLMEWLLKLIAPPGGNVLDPFLGTGSTAVGCARLGLDCTGIDLGADYLHIAQWRIDAELLEKSPVHMET